jgi:hypothetical protein
MHKKALLPEEEEEDGEGGEDGKEGEQEWRRGRGTWAAFSSSRSSFIRASDTLYNMNPKLGVHPLFPHVICVHTNLKAVVGGVEVEGRGVGRERTLA